MFSVQVHLRRAALIVTAFSALLAPARAAASPDYRVHAGDVLNIQVFGEPTLSQPATVLTDGSIVYPLIGREVVGGETLESVDRQLSHALAAYIHNPIVNVAVTTQGMLNILVLGNVKLPGKYALPPDSRLADALAAAGGIGPTDGEYLPARISVGTQNLETVSLEKLLHDGDVSLNVPLRNNTVVYVPNRTLIRVRVVGAVDRPGDIEVGEGDHLTMAIAKAGSSASASSDLNHVHITRQNPNGTSSAFEVNVYRELQQGDMRGDPVLQKGDIVYVPQARHGAQGAGGGILGALRQIFLPY